MEVFFMSNDDLIKYALASGARFHSDGSVSYQPNSFSPKLSFNGSDFILHFHFSVDTLLSSKPFSSNLSFPFLSLFIISDSFLNKVARCSSVGKKFPLPFNKSALLSLIYNF